MTLFPLCFQFDGERMSSLRPDRSTKRANLLVFRGDIGPRASEKLEKAKAVLSAPALHLDFTDSLDNAIVYAVGDIHGMSRLLDDLISGIEVDAANHGRPALVIFLGDVVNRGPASREVVERLLAGPRRLGDRWIVLRGNHEQAFIDALRDEASFNRFLRKGGIQTMLSYGLKRKDMTLGAMRAHVPREHLIFLNSLPLTCRIGELLFVHAGVERGKALEDQAPESLMNIREPFLSSRHDLPFTIVHGHVPSAGLPVLADGRICIDTGAVTTGVLTAAVFQDDRPPRFMRAHVEVKRSA
jgi:serine/threonine protein phosphatase 1